jgi:hypothetical protein|nr:MAG TPA: hypothetical protein [Caudoviricetes sp.]
MNITAPPPVVVPAIADIQAADAREQEFLNELKHQTLQERCDSAEFILREATWFENDMAKYIAEALAYAMQAVVDLRDELEELQRSLEATGSQPDTATALEDIPAEDATDDDTAGISTPEPVSPPKPDEPESGYMQTHDPDPTPTPGAQMNHALVQRLRNTVIELRAVVGKGLHKEKKEALDTACATIEAVMQALTGEAPENHGGLV